MPLIRGGEHQTYNGEDFIKTVVWKFPSYKKAIERHNLKITKLDGV